MTIRELIEGLEDIARRAGDRLDVRVIVDAYDDDGDGLYSSDPFVEEVRYAGGSYVELRT